MTQPAKKIVLDPEYHEALMKDRVQVCLTAGIQSRFLEESMRLYCGKDELDWVWNFEQYERDGMPGLLMVGLHNPWTTCQAIAGALVRYYLDARVMTLNAFLDADDIHAAHILLIPNFHEEKQKLLDWKMQTLFDKLLARTLRGRSNVLCIEKGVALPDVFGKSFADYLGEYRRVSTPEVQDALIA